MSGASSKRNSAVGRSLDAKAGYLIAFTDGYALPHAEPVLGPFLGERQAPNHQEPAASRNF